LLILLFIRDPELIKQVANDEIFLKEPFAIEIQEHNGLVIANGEVWKKMRKICNGAFNISFLRMFVEPMNRCIEPTTAIFNANLSAKGKLKPLRIDNMITALVMDIIGQTMVSLDFEAVSAGGNEFTKSLARYLDIEQKRQLSPLYWILNPTLPSKQKACANYMINYVDAVVAHRIELRQHESHPDAKDLVDLVLDARDSSGQGLTPGEIRTQVSTFLAAGHETTAQAICLVISDVAANAHVSEKLQEELHQIFGDSDRYVEYEDTHKMPYLTAVIKESLRVHPVAAEMLRRTSQDTELAGYKIPKGTLIALAYMGLHHNSHAWKNPALYDPTRFLQHDEAAEDASNSDGSYGPFGFGRRSCIGRNFAMLEMRIVLATLLRKFRFEHASHTPIILTQKITIRPVALNMAVWPRDK